MKDLHERHRHKKRDERHTFETHTHTHAHTHQRYKKNSYKIHTRSAVKDSNVKNAH